MVRQSLGRVLAGVLSAFMLVNLCGFAPLRADSGEYSYVDTQNGGSTETATGVTALTGSETELTDGWYAVDTDVTYSSALEVSGNVDLILCDGATLRANGGIVVYSGARFTIYGQSSGTGAIIANPDVGPGIGGSENFPSGLIIICGGTITANGRYNSAGIGGAPGQDSGIRGITIYGGKVTASGGIGGAGIGNGQGNDNNGDITIYGGTVIANGGEGAAGIGVNDGICNQIYLRGGSVTAKAGSGARAIGENKGNSYKSNIFIKYEDTGSYMTVLGEDGNPVPALEREDACRSGYAKIVRCGHEFDYVTKDADSHELYCGYCGYSETEPHDCVNDGDMCSDCGYIKGGEELTVTLRGASSNQVSEVQVLKGASYSLPACTFAPPSNQQFVGWKVGDSTQLSQPGEIIWVMESVTITAQYNTKTSGEAQFKIFTTIPNPQPMPNVDPITISYEDMTIEFPAFIYEVPEGKAFAGWSVGSPYGTVYMPGESCTLESWQINAGQLFAQFIDGSLPEFSHYSIVLKDQVGLIFYMDLKGKTPADYPDTYVTFSGNRVDDTVQYPLADATVDPDSGEYVFILELASIQMADKMTPVFHYKDGTTNKTLSGTPHSVQDYIEWAIACDMIDAEKVDVVKALATYGHHAQIYLSDNAAKKWQYGVDYAPMSTYYNASGHAVDPYSSSYITEVRSRLSAMTYNTDSGCVTKVAQRLRFGSTLTLDIRLDLADGVSPSDLTVTVNGEPAKISNNNGTYMVSIRDIYASDLTAGYEIVVSGVGNDCTINTSPMSYLHYALGSSNAALQQLACALYDYAVACKTATWN
ncbi:MAG: hypothetical protein J5379_00640 [Clostridiales bacterium]|nr:hypothetical protein [Clostridiales bacterium]